MRGFGRQPGGDRACPDGGRRHLVEDRLSCALCMRGNLNTGRVKLASNEHAIQRMGLTFFSVPIELRPYLFPGTNLGLVQAAFLGVDGAEPAITRGCRGQRVTLEEVDAPLRSDQIEAAGERLDDPVADFQDDQDMAVGELSTAFKVRKVFDLPPGVGLPPFELALAEEAEPQRYDEFKKWALTLRQVETAMRLGATEKEAISELIADASREEPEEGILRSGWAFY